MTLRQVPPALVTTLTLACGLAALEAVRVGDWVLTLRLLLMAAVADGADGMLARRLGAVSPMGAQFDSLADIIAFGVAPAFLFATYYGSAPDGVRFGVALAFVLAGAYRLARFHAQPTHTAFCGLPITAAGSLLVVIVAGPFRVGVPEAAAASIALAVLMVSHHPFPKLPRSHQWLLLVAAAAVFPVVLWPHAETLAIVATSAFGAYVLWGLVGQMVADSELLKRKGSGINVITEGEVQEAGRPHP